MSKAGMKVVVEAPALTPIPVSIEFVASVLRNMQGADAVAVDNKIREAVSKAREDGRDYAQKKYADLKKQTDEFEAASGIKLTEYTEGKELGEAVATLRHLKWRMDAVTQGIRACSDIGAMLEQVKTLADLSAEVKDATQ